VEAATDTVDAAADIVPTDLVADAVPAPAEPEMIEVWRPGRFEARERPRNARGARHHGRRGGERSVAAPATAEANGAQPADAQASANEAHPQHEGPRRHHRGHRSQRGDRPDGQRPQHHGKHGRHNDKRQRNEKPERRERPERQPDPNSPFAKLAALKAQLESGGKEKS
jgi:ATP-dependent RNA helicase SUPV3L1/SUV3